jgi:hypothetical protein
MQCWGILLERSGCCGEPVVEGPFNPVDGEDGEDGGW